MQQEIRSSKTNSGYFTSESFNYSIFYTNNYLLFKRKYSNILKMVVDFIFFMSWSYLTLLVQNKLEKMQQKTDLRYVSQWQGGSSQDSFLYSVESRTPS